MRCSGLLAVLLLAGCSTTGHEIGVGVGREFRDGGFTASGSGGGEHPASGDTNLLVDYDERDIDSVNLWYVWKFDTPRERVLDGPASSLIHSIPPEHDPTPEGPEDSDTMSLGKESMDLVEALVILLAALASVFGGVKAKQKWDERKGKRN